MIHILYITSPNNKKIYVWKFIDHTKTIILELMQVVRTPGTAQSIVVHPNKRFLYVGVRPNYGIHTYHIDHLGFLSDMEYTKIFSSSTFLTSNTNGTFLYCAAYQESTISVIPVKKSGIPDSPIQIIEKALGCHSVNIDKHQTTLWVPCLHEDTIRLFTIQRSGLLKIPQHFKYIKVDNGAGPRHMSFNKNNGCAYIINELTSTINVIQYNFSKKILKIIQTLNITPKNIITKKFWASDIHVHPNGRWLYCSDRATNIISIFEISYTTQQLKFIDYQLTETQPRGFAIDPMGKFLVVAGQESNYISIYKINLKNGKLTILYRCKSGLGPVWIQIISIK